jgi:hypothetical protein
MRRQKYWYLGCFSIIGVYKLTDIFAAFIGLTPWYDALNMAWFLWALYFIPEENDESEPYA